ncbi:MAG: Mur ligase family protein, partial [bacterium]|nr:Mur ligase family protein [bacterium]
MASISSFDDINAVLAEYIPLSSQITGKQITLARMRPLMAALDNPHKRLKIVHVAGTSGKTSTAYFVAALLSAAGKKTGLTVSPHVDSVTERIQINMQPIEAQIFSNLLTEFVSIIESASIEPTYFELLVAFAYWYFAKQKVDYAVVETGMGGLHDGTNIADNSDKICVITDIGLDHMHILGSTVAEIATQKAGIIHNGNVVIMYEQDQVITQVVQNLCEKVGSKLMLQYELELRSFGKSSVDEMPIFQQRNWLLAKATYDFLKTRDNLINISMTNLLRSTQNVVVPGRMETAIIGHKKIIMDGAH